MKQFTNELETALQGMGMNTANAGEEYDWVVSDVQEGGWHIASFLPNGLEAAMAYFDELLAVYSDVTLIGWFKGMALYHAGKRHDEDEKHREMLEWLENGRYRRSNFFYEVQVWLGDDEDILFAYAFTVTEAESIALQHHQQLHGPEATIDNIISVSLSEIDDSVELKPVGFRIAQ